MADIVRRAEARWNGNLIEGGGSFTVGSGALGDQDISWGARTEAPGGNTSPEELIAASHASCYAMAFSHTLAEAGSPADSLSGLCRSVIRSHPGRRLPCRFQQPHCQRKSAGDRPGAVRRPRRARRGGLPDFERAARQRRNIAERYAGIAIGIRAG